MARGNGILERMFARSVSYPYADRSDRRKLIAVFAVALLLFTVHMVQGIRYYNMRETTATVIGCRAEQHKEYGKGSFARTSVSYYAKVEYAVYGVPYREEVRVDGPMLDGETIRVYYDLSRPEHLEYKKNKMALLAFLLCLLHLFIMKSTGIPYYLMHRND